jgi:hypothetical protein
MKTAQEFKEFFSAIPEEKWFIGYFVSDKDPNMCCALGHLGHRFDKATNNSKLFLILCNKVKVDSVTEVNDKSSKSFPQPTPKQRILALCDKMIAAGL